MSRGLKLAGLVVICVVAGLLLSTIYRDKPVTLSDTTLQRKSDSLLKVNYSQNILAAKYTDSMKVRNYLIDSIQKSYKKTIPVYDKIVPSTIHADIPELDNLWRSIH